MQIYCTPFKLYALCHSLFLKHDCGICLPDDGDFDYRVTVASVRAEMVDGDFSFASFPRYQVTYSLPFAPNVEVLITLDMQYMDYWFLTVSAWAADTKFVDLFFVVNPSTVDEFGIFLMEDLND